MPERPGSPESDDLAGLATLLCELGGAMISAGAPVQGVRERLERTAAAYGAPESRVVVLPTVVLVETQDAHRSQIQVGASQETSPRFDQIDATYQLQERCVSERMPPPDALRRLRAIEAAPPASPAVLRVLGHGLLTAGFSLLIQPSLLQLAICFALGLVIGLLKLARLHEFHVVFPVLVTFGVAVLAFALSEHVDALDNPMRLLIPPLVTFLPAGAMSTGTAELAAGQMIAGASRLVSGVVTLLLLSFSIVAAAVVVGLPPSGLDDQPVDQLGSWSGWVGIVLFALGTWWHFCVPTRALSAMGTVLVVAYAGQLVGEAVFAPELSGFVGALVMTPVVLFFSSRPGGPPSMITFLPGFWMLVPGSTGLIGVTELLGIDGLAGGEAFAAALVGVVGIALGALVGSSLHDGVARRGRLQEAVPPSGGHARG